MEGIKIKEILEVTRFGNREVSDWINTRYEGLEREAAFATVRFLAEKYPGMNNILNVSTRIEESGGAKGELKSA